MEKEVFIINNIKVTKDSGTILRLGSLLADNSNFATRSALTEVANILLDRDEYQNAIIYYDGCYQFNSK